MKPVEKRKFIRQDSLHLLDYLIVDEEGRPSDIKIKSLTHQGFGEAAIEAVKKWTFKPGYIQGKPVKCRASTRIIFSLGY